MKNEERLLREYVKRVLKEDDGFVASTDGGSPYGVSWGSNEDLYSTFVQPFVDVFKTGVAKTKEVATKTRTLLWVSLQTILTSIIPGYGYNYAEVFDKEKERIDKIRSEYKDVFDRTDEALASSDAAFLAFMASPALVLGTMAGSMAPAAFKGTLSAATGGLSDEIYDSAKNAAVKAGRWSLGDSGKSKSSNSKKSPKDASSLFDSLGESSLKEDDNVSETKKGVTPKKILTNKKFLKKSFESPKLKEMQKVATEIYRDSLKQIYAQAEGLLKNAKTVEDLEKLSKKKIPDLEKIKKLQGEEKAAAERILLDGVRKSMKDFYIKNLTQQVDGVIKAGIPEESQYVKDFRSTIQKIKAL